VVVIPDVATALEIHLGSLEDNDGIIVWDSDKEEYIPWREVEEIVFN